MKNLLLSLSLVAFSASIGHAQTPEGVPASATKLDAAGIRQLYQGAYASFDNKQNKVTLTGEIFYDLKGGYALGTYVWDKKDAGIFKGKIRLKGDRFCYKSPNDPETCSDVWLDGKTYYEVDAKGKIASIDKLLEVPSAPKDAKKLKPDELLALVKGKRVLVAIFDYGKPLVADVKWDLKKKASVGKYIFAKEEGKANVKYTIEGDQFCFVTGGKKNCYDYYATENGFIEVNAKGDVHGVSVFR